MTEMLLALGSVYSKTFLTFPKSTQIARRLMTLLSLQIQYAPQNRRSNWADQLVYVVFIRGEDSILSPRPDLRLTRVPRPEVSSQIVTHAEVASCVAGSVKSNTNVSSRLPFRFRGTVEVILFNSPADAILGCILHCLQSLYHVRAYIDRPPVSPPRLDIFTDKNAAPSTPPPSSPPDKLYDCEGFLQYLNLKIAKKSTEQTFGPRRSSRLRNRSHRRICRLEITRSLVLL